MVQDNVPQNEGLLIILTVSMLETQKISFAQVKGHMFLSILFLASCLPLSDRLSTWYVKNKTNRENRCSILVFCLVFCRSPFVPFILLSIVFYFLLRHTASDFPFDIFNDFLR